MCCDRDKLEELFRDKRLRNLNFFAYGLIFIGLILRFLVTDAEDSGIGDTPYFLFIVQFIITIIFVMLLLFGEMHRPAPILICFPLLMSRSGRGALIMMLGIPITNFTDIWTVIIAAIVTTIGVINFIIGFRDGPVELKYAEENDYKPSANLAPVNTADPPKVGEGVGGFPRPNNYQMQPPPNQN